MPTYCSITTFCVSQYDIKTIPEFPPPTTSTDPFQNVPPLVSDNGLVSVYLPTYPSSQFWLCYSIAPPHPPKALYYFKLYINGKMIVSWGCGAEERYKGSTMFGLFSGRDALNHSRLERRVLFFGPEREYGGNLTLDSQDDVMEIKVFRSKGRKRIEPEVQDYHSLCGTANSKSQQHSTESGLNLVNAGPLSADHPRRYYKYALIDPLDQPFATFRYYCRSWDQLEALGVISPPQSVEASSGGSHGSIERPLSRKSSNHTLESYVTVSDSLYDSTNPSTDTIMHHPNSDISRSIASAQDDSTTSTIETESRPGIEQQDLSSPLRARIVRPFTLPRPGTPPPSTTPPKLAQLPPMMPLTDTALNTLASKESFASLVRTLPSHDTSAYQLHELVAEPRPATPLRTRSTSMSVLTHVLSSVKNRRKRSSKGSEGEEVQSPPSNVDDQATNKPSTPPKLSSDTPKPPTAIQPNKPTPSPVIDIRSQPEAPTQPTHPTTSRKTSSESATTSVNLSSPKPSEGTPFDGIEDDVHTFHSMLLNPVEKCYLRRKNGKADNRRDSTSGGSAGSGSHHEGERGRKRAGRKQQHLWEQL